MLHMVEKKINLKASKEKIKKQISAKSVEFSLNKKAKMRFGQMKLVLLSLRRGN